MLTWLTADNQDSAQLAINPADGTYTRQAYLPFGGQRGSQGPPAGTENGYLNHPYDTNTGLIQDGARLYDPVLARFISPDPLVASGESQGLNAYSYAKNNPMSASDPTGLFGLANCDSSCSLTDRKNFIPIRPASSSSSAKPTTVKISSYVLMPSNDPELSEYQAAWKSAVSVYGQPKSAEDEYSDWVWICTESQNDVCHGSASRLTTLYFSNASFEAPKGGII